MILILDNIDLKIINRDGKRLVGTILGGQNLSLNLSELSIKVTHLSTTIVLIGSNGFKSGQHELNNLIGRSESYKALKIKIIEL